MIDIHASFPCRRFPNRLALVVKRNGRLQTWNYGQYYADAVRFARGLIYVGADMFQGVSILGFNSPEWVIGNMGAILAGCLPAGIYTTNGPESCHYVASHCAAAVVLVENEVQLKKILSVRDRLPALKAIVQWTGEVSENIPGVYSWSSFLSLGEQQESTQVELSRRLGKITPGHCATLIYTSVKSPPDTVTCFHIQKFSNILPYSYSNIHIQQYSYSKILPYSYSSIFRYSAIFIFINILP